MATKQVKQLINKIPYWIRFTAKCPFKTYGLKAPEEAKQYFGFLKGFYGVDEEFDKCIHIAASWATKEKRERSLFKKILESAPIEIIYEYGIEKSKTAYQRSSTRNQFLAKLCKWLRENPIRRTPTGFNDGFKPYFYERQIFKHEARNIPVVPVKPAQVQMRVGSYVHNFC